MKRAYIIMVVVGFLLLAVEICSILARKTSSGDTPGVLPGNLRTVWWGQDRPLRRWIVCFPGISFLSQETRPEVLVAGRGQEKEENRTEKEGAELWSCCWVNQEEAAPWPVPEPWALVLENVQGEMIPVLRRSPFISRSSWRDNMWQGHDGTRILPPKSSCSTWFRVPSRMSLKTIHLRLPDKQISLSRGEKKYHWLRKIVYCENGDFWNQQEPRRAPLPGNR